MRPSRFKHCSRLLTLWSSHALALRFGSLAPAKLNSNHALLCMLDDTVSPTNTITNFVSKYVAPMHLSGQITSPIPLENVEIRHVIVKLPANEIATVHYAAWEDTDGSVLMVNFTGSTIEWYEHMLSGSIG